jgi:uncharacterized membrane protein
MEEFDLLIIITNLIWAIVVSVLVFFAMRFLQRASWSDEKKRAFEAAQAQRQAAQAEQWRLAEQGRQIPAQGTSLVVFTLVTVLTALASFAAIAMIFGGK